MVVRGGAGAAGVDLPTCFGDGQLLEAFSTEPGLISSMRERTEAQKKSVLEI